MEENLEDEEEILMDHCPYIISFLTEFFGMVIQMFTGCLGSVYTYDIGPVITTFSFGLGRLACYEIFNHISPLHINPAKSLGYVVLGRMHLLRFVVYVIAQYSGSITGFAIVKAVIPPNIPNVCLNHVSPKILREQALAMELVATMILMLAVAGATDPVNEKCRETIPLRMGLIVGGLVLVLDIHTGAGKNPARSLSPALLYNSWHDYWLFEIGPYCGAIIGALLYRFVFHAHYKRHPRSLFVR